MLVELYCFQLAVLSVPFCGHSKLIIYHLISSKFRIWIALIKLSSSNMGFVRQTITKMADKMDTAYQFEIVDTLSHLSPDFYELLSSNSRSSSNIGYERFSRWPPKCPLHLRLWAFLLSHLTPDFFQISYMSYFYQTLAQNLNVGFRQ